MSTVQRDYHQDLDDLPQIAFPDWQLLGRIEELFSPYVGLWTAPGPPPMFGATDHRGTYRARSAEELCQLAEAQEKAPHLIQVSLDSPGAQDWRIFNIWMDERGSGGRISSSDEAVVDHVVARLRSLFALAAERLEKAQKPTPESEPELGGSVSESRGRMFAKHPLVAIGGATVAGVLAGAILILLFGQ